MHRQSNDRHIWHESIVAVYMTRNALYGHLYFLHIQNDLLFWIEAPALHPYCFRQGKSGKMPWQYI